MCRLNARLDPFGKEALDALVAEALDHRAIVSRTDTRVKLAPNATGMGTPAQADAESQGIQHSDPADPEHGFLLQSVRLIPTI
jgi:hypothetical protein